MGDLARDAAKDRSYPKDSDSKDGIRKYLNQKHAGPNMLKAFDEGWDRYKDERKEFDDILHVLQKIRFLR